MSADHPAAKSPPALFAALFGDGSLDDAVASLTTADTVPPGPASLVQNEAAPLPGDDPAAPAPVRTAFAPADSSRNSLREPPSDYRDQSRDYAADADLGAPRDTGSADPYGAASDDASWLLDPIDAAISASPPVDVPLEGPSYDGSIDTSWLELEADPLAETAVVPAGNALAEVDRLLARVGLSSGSDFQDVLAWLDPDLRTREVLCRCLPGLARQWDRYADVITDALQQVGPGLVPDPEATVRPLLTEVDGLTPGLDTCEPDPIALYRHELAAMRVLSREEQLVLGQWIADARYLVEKSTTATVHTDWVRAADMLLKDCIRDLWEACPLVRRALPGQPASAAQWRAALVQFGLRGTGDGQVAKIASAMHQAEDDIRARLRRAEAICRILPDAALAELGEQIARFAECSSIGDGLGAEDFAVDFARRIERAEAARRVLVRHTLRFVVAIARPYVQALQSLALSDLVQEGTLGLMRAVDKWEPGRGYALTTFAGWWIKQAITRAIADDDLVVRLPVHVGDRIRPALTDRALSPPGWREQQELDSADIIALERLGRSNSAWDERLDLICAAGVAESTAALIAGVIDPAPLEGELLTLAEATQDDDPDVDPEQAVMTRELVADVYLALDSIPARERRVLELRFGLGNDGSPRTLEVVGREFGITRERVRQIEAKAMKDLLHPSRAKYLEPLLVNQAPRRSVQTSGKRKSHGGAAALGIPSTASSGSPPVIPGTDWRAAPDRIAGVLEGALAELTPALRRLVMMRYGLHNEKRHSFEDLERRLGVPREIVLRMLADALGHLRVRAGTWVLDALVSGTL